MATKIGGKTKRETREKNQLQLRGQIIGIKVLFWDTQKRGDRKPIHTLQTFQCYSPGTFHMDLMSPRQGK